MLFYAALHATGAAMYGNTSGQVHGLHERDLLEKRPAIAHEYLALRELSEDARYRPGKHPMKADLARRLTTIIFAGV
jgi:hypothetical protein